MKQKQIKLLDPTCTDVVTRSPTGRFYSRSCRASRMNFSLPTRSLVKPVTSNTGGFRDMALIWAESNPSLAQSSLDIPPLDDNEDATIRLHPPTFPCNFDEYWRERWWSFPPIESKTDRKLAQSLTTHVLSAPLTLASQLRRQVSQAPASSEYDASHMRFQRWCCIGARAEASLPVQYWRELLVVLGWTTESHLNLELDFLGPDIPFPKPNVLLEHQGSSLLLRWLYSGKFHDYLSSRRESPMSASYDTLVLFNPGLGHANLKAEWKPTLDLLLHDNRPILLTAHSALDAGRESKYLLESFGLSVPYSENPFASHITYEDPFDKRHFVRPNHYAALVKSS